MNTKKWSKAFSYRAIHMWDGLKLTVMVTLTIIDACFALYQLPLAKNNE